MRILPIQYSHNKPNFNGKYKVPEPFRLGDAADERIYIYIYRH